jgi:hypothetical protein
VVPSKKINYACILRKIRPSSTPNICFPSSEVGIKF